MPLDEGLGDLIDSRVPEEKTVDPTHVALPGGGTVDSRGVYRERVSGFDHGNSTLVAAGSPKELRVKVAEVVRVEAEIDRCNT